jgi:hypothetical protein
MALVPTINSHEKNRGAVDSKQRTDCVELSREDLQDDEREGELAESCAHVGAFEGALRGADFDESVVPSQGM